MSNKTLNLGGMDTHTEYLHPHEGKHHVNTDGETTEAIKEAVHVTNNPHRSSKVKKAETKNESGEAADKTSWEAFHSG